MSFLMEATRGVLMLARRRNLPTTGTALERARPVISEPPVEAEPTRAIRRDAIITRRVIGGRQLLHLTPRHGGSGHQLLYYHGGGWVGGIIQPQWWLLRALLNRTGADIWVPSYPLAPRHTIDDTIALIPELHDAVAAATGNKRFVVAGDSAGGNLAIVHALLNRDRDVRQPDHLLLFAPATDLAFNDPRSLAIEPHDPLLALPWVSAVAELWAGSRPLTDPLVSPVHANLSGLAPMDLFIGDKDILMPDARTFADRVRRAGGTMQFHETRGGFHVYSAVTALPEARRDMDIAAAAITGTRVRATERADAHSRTRAEAPRRH